MTATPAPQRLAPGEFQTITALIRKSGGGFESTISGTSMQPTIPDGARIRISPPESGEYQVGQIVACVLGDSLFAHRIVYCGRSGRSGAYVLTQGDGWALCDPPTRKTAILGIVTEISKGGDWRTPTGGAARGSWMQAVATASFWLNRLSLLLHPEFSRRVAGTCLFAGSVCRRLGVAFAPTTGSGSARE